MASYEHLVNTCSNSEKRSGWRPSNMRSVFDAITFIKVHGYTLTVKNYHAKEGRVVARTSMP